MRTSPSHAPLSAGSAKTAPQRSRPPVLEIVPVAGSIPSSALFQKRREVTITHEGALYRLRITRQGKLILNK